MPDYCDPEDPSRWTHTDTDAYTTHTHTNTWHLILGHYLATIAACVDYTHVAYSTYLQILNHLPWPLAMCASRGQRVGSRKRPSVNRCRRGGRKAEGGMDEGKMHASVGVGEKVIVM